MARFTTNILNEIDLYLVFLKQLGLGFLRFLESVWFPNLESVWFPNLESVWFPNYIAENCMSDFFTSLLQL